MSVANLPKRQRGQYSSRKFKAVDIVTNHYEATLDKIEKIVIFNFKITPRVESKNDEELKSIWRKVKDEVKKHIKNPVWRKFVVFSS